MGRITTPSITEMRRCTTVCERLTKRYDDNWRVRVNDCQGGARINIVTHKKHALHATIVGIDLFGFHKRNGSVAEIEKQIAAEIDDVLATIEHKPLFTIISETDGNGNTTHYDGFNPATA